MIPTISRYKFWQLCAAYPEREPAGFLCLPCSQSNPEVVAPQSIIRATVTTEGNESLANAILTAAVQIVEVVEKKDTTVKLNDKVLAKSTNKVNASRGYNLGLQST